MCVHVCVCLCLCVDSNIYENYIISRTCTGLPLWKTITVSASGVVGLVIIIAIVTSSFCICRLRRERIGIVIVVLVYVIMYDYPSDDDAPSIINEAPGALGK